MNELSTVQRAEAYINVHLMHAGPLAPPPAVGPFVTISRESGTGGSLLAEALRQRLPCAPGTRPWRVYGRNLINEVLRTNDLPGSLARFLPEDRIHEVDASIGELVGLHPNLWWLVEKTNDLMRQVARAGNAILVGRGASFATKAIPTGVHVRLVAPPEYRAKVTAGRLSLREPAAMTRNAARDAARQRYVRSTFDADVCDPSGYHFVANVAEVSAETIAEFIARLIETETPEPSRGPRSGEFAAAPSHISER